MKKIFIVAILLITTHFAFSQVSASISPDFKITIENPTQKIPEYIEFDIQDLAFKSEEDLTKFCLIFSSDFQNFTGNWTEQKIRIQFDTNILAERAYDLAKLNHHYSMLSKRMLITYDNL
jgi:hypothetical protein